MPDPMQAPKCGAKTRGGKTCQNPPMDDQERCRMHGGASPQARAAAGQRRREREAAAAAASFALPIEVGPGEALLQEVHRTAGVIAWLYGQILRVTGEDPEGLIFGLRSQKEGTTAGEHGGAFSSTEHGPGVHEWLKLWQAERTHLRKVCGDALRAGVEERRIQLAESKAEEQGQLMRDYIEDLRTALNLDDTQLEQAYEAAEHRFMLLQGGLTA